MYISCKFVNLCKNITHVIICMHDNNNLETNKCFPQDLHSNNIEWNSWWSLRDIAVKRDVERHTLNRKLEGMTNCLLNQKIILLVFCNVECNLIYVFETWCNEQFKLCAWFITRNFFSLLIIRFLRYVLKGRP